MPTVNGPLDVVYVDGTIFPLMEDAATTDKRAAEGCNYVPDGRALAHGIYK
jgi:hypothetical protein